MVLNGVHLQQTKAINLIFVRLGDLEIPNGEEKKKISLPLETDEEDEESVPEIEKSVSVFDLILQKLCKVKK